MISKRVFLSVTISGVLFILIINSFNDLLFLDIVGRNLIVKRNIFHENKTQFNLVDSGGLVNVLKLTPMNHNFVKGILKTKHRSMTIFVHGAYDFISKRILEQSTWESSMLTQMEDYLGNNSNMILLDIGCNIGIYTLTAASLGNKVIAVDANKNNTDRLVQSIVVNEFSQRVSVVLNAVSNVRKEYSLSRDSSNVGAQWVEEVKSNESYKVKSIFLDDLLLLVNNKSVDFMMKMDIEQHEGFAIKRAANLFDKKNIKLVLMEWVHIKVHQHRDELIKFFLQRSYKPYFNFFVKQPLFVFDNISWPDDIVWRKN